MSSEELNEMEVEDVVMDVALDGVDDVEDGLDSLELAGEVATMATGEAMAAASDLTRAVDTEVVADRLATLADVVGAAGVNDLAEGADLLMAADDVDAMSAAVGLMSLGDLDRGLEFSRLAGELADHRRCGRHAAHAGARRRIGRSRVAIAADWRRCDPACGGRAQSLCVDGGDGDGACRSGH